MVDNTSDPEEIDEEVYNNALRKKIADLALKGAKVENLGKMCSTCAFKFDSDANLEPHNVEAAWECLAYGATFNCHITTGVNKNCECTGFKYAKVAIQKLLFKTHEAIKKEEERDL